MRILNFGRRESEPDKALDKTDQAIALSALQKSLQNLQERMDDPAVIKLKVKRAIET